MPRRTAINTALPAAIYARYSSHNQNDASIEQQIEACTAYAQQRGLTIAHTYTDHAVSGRSDRRPGFQLMMKEAEAGKFRYLISWKSSRIGRNMMEAMVNDARLQDYGVTCMYVEEDFDDTASGRFMLRTMMNVNQLYSEAMAEDIRRGMMDNAKQGKVNGQTPLGYKRDPATGKYVIDEDEAAIVRELFERVFSGEQYVAIARDLNARGVRTSTGHTWGRTSIQHLLVNERYKGVYSFSDHREEDVIPPIVSKELFNAVQERLKMKKHNGKKHTSENEYLLTGKLFCGHCGSQMTGMSVKKKTGAQYYYYACHNRRTTHTCTKKHAHKDVLEATVTRAIMSSMLTDANIQWMADMVIEYQEANIEDPQITYLKARLQEIDKALENILNAIEAGIFNNLTGERMDALQEEKKEILEKLDVYDYEVPKVTREQVIEMFEQYRSGDPDDVEFQKQLILHFIHAVYVYDDKLRIVVDYSGDNNTFEIPFCLDDVEEATAEEITTTDSLAKRDSRFTTKSLYKPRSRQYVTFCWNGVCNYPLFLSNR